MKKLFLIIICIILFCFLIPVLFTNKFEIKETVVLSKNEIVEENNNNEYDYKEYSKIKLYHTKSSEIEEIELDKYLYSVVSAEMPASFEKEALKAQAVVARTYTIYKIKNNVGKHEGADICDDSTCCQAWISKEDRLAKWEEDKKNEYWNKIVDSVESTKGKYITYNGEPINAFFHSNSGGKTEIPLNVWGRKWVSVFTNSRNKRRRCIFSI